MDYLGNWSERQPGKLNGNQSNQLKAEQIEPAAFYAKPALGTVEDVVAFGSGPGTEDLNGTVDSTIVFKILRDEL
ncbi:MAG: hypothetical protein DME83_07320 [Verrucomicrobia bacterium]|nr:MAG: hypothetical protein DME83_07320 [Verrucomicrobiota bacterium]